MTTPERPLAVPSGAVFASESSEWELYELDEAGVRHGAFSTFRADGTPVARGTYARGKLDGAVSRFTSGEPGAVLLRVCCVPPEARELRTSYHAGRLLHEVFYDGSGRPICDDGTPWPERVGNVPADAVYDDMTRHFIARREGEDGSFTLAHFNVEGLLAEEVDARAGRAEARRSFAPDGTCNEETGLDDDRRRHGAYVARVAPGERHFRDTRVRELRGEHEHGEPTGVWALHDATGGLLRRLPVGAPLAPALTPLLLGSEPPRATSADELWRLAGEEAARSPRAALAVAARALAKSRDQVRFERFVGEHTLGLEPALASARGDEAACARDVSPSSLLGAVLLGAAPGAALRRLSSLLRGHAPAALDYLDASLVLAPEQAMAPLARGILCVEQGDPNGALDAAELLGRESGAAADLLRQFVNVAYGGYAFAPERDGVGAPDDELIEIEPAQPLPAVKLAIALYATRIAVVRDELRERGVPERWLPPETGALLPEGRVELRSFTARIEDEGENGPEISEVAIDETLPLDRSVLDLARLARSDWAALGWLCWSVGLDEVRLPESLAPRPDFAAAMHQATLRCWRAHDRLRTQGLAAMARRAASFDWEGMAVDSVPSHLIETVAAEYLEVRAAFFWLTFEQNQSPFQSDLRRA